MSEVVYSFAREGVFSLQVTGRNGGRYEAYCGRLGVEPGSEGSFVEEMTPDGPRRGAPGQPGPPRPPRRRTRGPGRAKRERRWPMAVPLFFALVAP